MATPTATPTATPIIPANILAALEAFLAAAQADVSTLCQAGAMNTTDCLYAELSAMTLEAIIAALGGATTARQWGDACLGLSSKLLALKPPTD